MTQVIIDGKGNWKNKTEPRTRVKVNFRNVKYKDYTNKVENEAKLLKQVEKPLELTIWGKIVYPKQKHHF